MQLDFEDGPQTSRCSSKRPEAGGSGDVHGQMVEVG
jgi:hypothetical protein